MHALTHPSAQADVRVAEAGGVAAGGSSKSASRSGTRFALRATCRLAAAHAHASRTYASAAARSRRVRACLQPMGLSHARSGQQGCRLRAPRTTAHPSGRPCTARTWSSSSSRSETGAWWEQLAACTRKCSAACPTRVPHVRLTPAPAARSSSPRLCPPSTPRARSSQAHSVRAPVVLTACVPGLRFPLNQSPHPHPQARYW